MARESQSPQVPVRPTEFPRTKESPQSECFEEPALGLRQPSSSEMPRPLLIPRHGFQSKIPGSSRSLDCRREKSVGFAVAKLAVNSSELHQQVRLEVGAAHHIAGQQRCLTQAFLGGPVGRGQIPHFQIQAGEIHRNGSQVGMIAHAGSQIARP